MVIVNQNRDLIVNFAGIQMIGRNVNNKTQVVSKSINNDVIILGEYSTEQRAAEILKEISLKYGLYQSHPQGCYSPLYEMPKE